MKGIDQKSEVITGEKKDSERDVGDDLEIPILLRHAQQQQRAYSEVSTLEEDEAPIYDNETASTTVSSTDELVDSSEMPKDPNDFLWMLTEEPHKSRRRAILKAHPEVGSSDSSGRKMSFLRQLSSVLKTRETHSLHLDFAFVDRSVNSWVTPVPPSPSSSSSSSFKSSSPSPSDPLPPSLSASSSLPTSSVPLSTKTSFYPSMKSPTTWLSKLYSRISYWRWSRIYRSEYRSRWLSKGIILNITSIWVKMGLIRIYRVDWRRFC